MTHMFESSAFEKQMCQDVLELQEAVLKPLEAVLVATVASQLNLL